MSKVYEVCHCYHKGELVYVGQGIKGRSRHCDRWRVLVTKVTNKYVTFFAGYDTITEEIEKFINGYTKEL